MDCINSVMSNNLLILDLDGVLVTSPPWRSDELDLDGYSKFNTNAVENLKLLAQRFSFDIWLIPSRRSGKTVVEFNRIFSNRGVRQPIKDFVPLMNDIVSRRIEIERFLDGMKFDNLLILEDDKSLRHFDFKFKDYWVEMSPLIGFDKYSLLKATEICKEWI